MKILQDIDIVLKSMDVSKPLFATEDDYMEFRERYAESVRDCMNKLELAHLKSKEASFSRIVN